jgi:hypothetical protein
MNPPFFLHILFKTYIIGLFLLLNSLLSGGITRSSSSGTSRGNSSTTSRDGSELGRTFSNGLYKKSVICIYVFSIVNGTYLSSGLAFHGLQQGRDTRLVNLDTDGAQESLEFISRGRGVTTSDEKKIGCEMLHCQMSMFKKRE